MIKEITDFVIKQEWINATKFQQISEVNQEPYMLAGHIIIFSVMLVLWFLFSFAKLYKGSKKLCFSSWINTRSLIIILIGILLYVFIFIFPVPTYFI